MTPVPATVATALLLVAVEARGQSIAEDRPVVPSAGVAAEGGPGALWVNPANMAFDPDPRFAVTSTWFDPTGAGQALPSIGAVTGAGGFGVGLHAVPLPDDATDWSLDYGTSALLPRRVALGARLAWHLVDGGPNYVGWDVGAAWRPLPWFGAAAVAHNIGGPDPARGVRARSGGGIALRPLGDFAMLGVDLLHTFDETAPQDDLVGTLRVRPIRGLYLRGGVTSTWPSGAPAPELTYGGGVELYFGDLGGMAHLDRGATGDRMTAWLGSDEPGEALVRLGKRVPVLRIDGTPPYEPAPTLFVAPEASWLELLERMRRAEDDPSVRGLVLAFTGGGLSWARAQELRQRVLALKDAGKPVTAYLHEAADTGTYYVASAANRVLLHPAQDVYVIGIDAELMFLRGALDMVGVEPQFVRRSEYKSAVEQFTATEPSPANLEQTEALLDDVFNEMVRAIATGRGRTEDEVRGWIDGGPMTSDEALAAGLVDGIVWPDQIEEQAEGELVDLRELPQPHSGWEAPSQIAIVYVEGVITPGKSSPGGLLGAKSTGSETVVRILDRIREDSQVKAVVLRVDSPGGSSFASEEIHRAVERVQREGKPVVVSMGALAASGGYYVSAGADAIWAEPMTITGSIGVYSGKFALAEAFRRFGVGTALVSRGRHATLESAITPWDDVQQARMEALVEHTYQQFKQRVAEGRSLTADQVETVARGHVWSGRRAAQVGLVDGLGGLHDAIEDARVRAGIPEKKRIALVSYDNGGVSLEAISPARMASLRAGARLVGRALALDRRAALALPRLPDAYDPLLAPVLYPEENVWMMTPWTIDAGTR